MGEAKRRALNHQQKNELMDRLEEIPDNLDPLEKAKRIVNATLVYATEEERVAILTDMENGGYEAVLNMLKNYKIPAGFDPADRPWNRS